MLKNISAFLIAGAISISAAAVYAEDNVEVYCDGEKKDFTISVEMIDNTVLVPIRPIFEMFNYKVEWDSMRQRIKTTTALGKLTIGIGSVLVSQNDYEAYVLPTYPRLINGQTMIPITFAADAADANIQYTQSNNSLIINSK